MSQSNFMFTENPPQNVQVGWSLMCGDAIEMLKLIPDNTVKCFVTSPPYFRKINYNHEGQAGLEDSVEEYIEYQKQVAREMLRCSTPDANLFWVIQDTTNGSGGTGGDYRNDDGSYRVKTVRGPQIKSWPRKAQLLIPERTRIAFSEVGWVPVLRIIWDKNDPRRAAIDRPSYSYEEVLLFSSSPESNLYEEILLFSKSPVHYWNRDSVLTPFADASMSQLASDYQGTGQHDYKAEGTENPSDTKRRIIESMKKRPGALLRAVWKIASGSQPVIQMGNEVVKGLACFPSLLAEICINLGSDVGDVVGDPYAGLGTTMLAALKWGRNTIGIELNPMYAKTIKHRLELAGY